MGCSQTCGTPVVIISRHLIFRGTKMGPGYWELRGCFCWPRSLVTPVGAAWAGNGIRVLQRVSDLGFRVLGLGFAV